MTFPVAVLTLLLIAASVAWWLTHRRSQRTGATQAAEIARLRASDEQARREGQQQLQAILDAMVEGVVVLDAQNAVRIANRAAAQLFRFTLPATGRALLEVVRHHEVAALATRLRNPGEHAVLGHELRLEETPARFLQINAVALHNPGGRPNGSVFVFHDLTRVRELEGMRQEFVANVSHELRTPLSLVTSATETLLDGVALEPDERGRLLAIIDRHAQRLTRLIDDLLLLSRLDSGRVALHLQPVALRAIGSEAMDDHMPAARAREMTLENEISPGVVALVDADRLHQVLSNLLDNAIKYGRPAGAVRMRARELDEQWVEVAVEDDGPGIPPEARERIFERFFRVDKSRGREQGGTGLGLAIVKHVVQAHGGEVRVTSESGQGTTFHFTLRRTAM